MSAFACAGAALGPARRAAAAPGTPAGAAASRGASGARLSGLGSGGRNVRLARLHAPQAAPAAASASASLRRGASCRRRRGCARAALGEGAPSALGHSPRRPQPPAAATLDAPLGAAAAEQPPPPPAAEAPPPPAAPPPAARSWADRLGFDLTRFGRHAEYGNGTPRALARGWLHLACVLAMEAALIAAAVGAWAPLGLPPRAAALIRWTTVGFYGSVLFHCVPWTRPATYTAALFLDFMTISLGFTGQVAAWVGLASAPGLASAALTAATLAICVGGVRQSAVPLWEFKRISRRNVVLAQFLLSSAVEAACIPNKALVAAIFALKVAGFLWYCTFGRHDAPKASPLTVPGVWGDHDNFHVITTAAAVLQIAAAAAV